MRSILKSRVLFQKTDIVVSGVLEQESRLQERSVATFDKSLGFLWNKSHDFCQTSRLEKFMNFFDKEPRPSVVHLEVETLIPQDEDSNK